MRTGITARLFLAVLLTSVATAVAVGYGVRAAFDTGFERYVADREETRLARLAVVFANAYREHGNWEFLRGNDERWIELNHLVRPMPGEGRMPPPPHFRPSGFGRPPPGRVVDAEGAMVAGDPPTAGPARERPILVDGKRVGTLVHPVRQTAFDVVDRRFQEEIWKASALVALIAMALSAVAAWFLARGLLAPVKRIANATRRLADGHYDTRVISTSSDELGRLADDFNRLGNALEKNEASRRHFMADVSHELRTPLAVLKGELEALEDGVRKPDRAALASLQAEVARLGKLVDDIHDLSLADVGGIAYRFEAVELAPLVREAIDHAAPRLEAARLRVSMDAGDPVVVRADPQRVRQLLGNLLENSLRYTDPDGVVEVSLSRREHRGVLRWQDSQPGVPAEALPRLFDRLYRVEGSRSRSAGGSGLGLAIARSIVEAQGGRIGASASPLGGVRIEVELPLAEAA